MHLSSQYAAGFFTLSVVALLVSYASLDSFATLFYPQLPIKNASEADVLIIGGSHAGLSAALTLARHQIDVLILDANAPRNGWKTPTHTLPTWEHQSPDRLREASRKELEKTGLVRFVAAQITTFLPPAMRDGLFEVQDAQGRKWKGKKLLSATGVEFAFPSIPGYGANFPDRM